MDREIVVLMEGIAMKMDANKLLEQGIDAIVQMRMREKPQTVPKELDVQFDEDSFLKGLNAIFEETET